jgi:hypothetical protein
MRVAEHLFHVAERAIDASLQDERRPVEHHERGLPDWSVPPEPPSVSTGQVTSPAPQDDKCANGAFRSDARPEPAAGVGGGLPQPVRCDLRACARADSSRAPKCFAITLPLFPTW